MAFPQDRLSTIVEPADYLPPDELYRTLDEDYELGPIDIGVTSAGIGFQTWHGTYNSGDNWITLTPALVGNPVQVLNVPGLTEMSFCFDANGNITIVYRANDIVSLYWFNTLINDYETTPSIAGALSAMVCLDDKRRTQTQFSDVLVVYTKEVGGFFILHQRRQRDRYEDEIDLTLPSWRYVWKLGMHEGVRVQITTVDVPPP